MNIVAKYFFNKFQHTLCLGAFFEEGYDSFDPSGSDSAELKNWAKENDEDCER